MSADYDPDFFAWMNASATRSARVLVPSLVELTTPRSVVDVGCGLGAWLRAFRSHGVARGLGLDGDYVPRGQLVIPLEMFHAVDLAQPFQLAETFDLVVCLEVAEHLSPRRAASFIEDLTRLAPLIVFSAAIPGQGGTQHVNERWPSEWAAEFQSHGFDAIDCLRDLVWDDPRVDYWYAQNTLIFARADALEGRPALRTAAAESRHRPLNRVHPRLYAERVTEAELRTRRFRELAPATAHAGLRAGRRRVSQAVSTAERRLREHTERRRG